MSPAFSSEPFDVVVIGGGPHGLTYAGWLKTWRPETRIAVVERLPRPGYKIGESLLSSATRSLVSMGLPISAQRRFFGNKAGLRFWWTGPETDRLHRPLDILDIEETFQVERRVLETALQEATRRRGIALLTDTRVDLRRSSFDGELKTIACIGPDGPFDLRTRMVCDASGPAALLAHRFGLYRRAPERNDTFTTHAYFGYFRLKSPVPIPHWDEPATRHACFPGGWTWFISLASWARTPDANLQRFVEHALDHGDGPDEALGSRAELAARFGCSYDPVVSIGFVVRDDRDDAPGRMPEERFRHYVERHPALREVMRHYEPVDPYGRGGFQGFRNLVHDSTQMAGDGWCLIGDAAAFTNPFFSPGLNFGSGSAYLGARATADALDAGDVSREAFVDYEAYMRDIYDAILNETDLYHRAFDHVDAYEWALQTKLVYAAADVIERESTYMASDPYVHGLLEPAFRAHVDRARAVLRRCEKRGGDLDAAAAEVRDVLRPFVRDVFARPDVQRLDLDAVFSNYTTAGDRVEGKRRPRGRVAFRRCGRCGFYADDRLGRCPVCGVGAARQAA